MKTYKTPIYIKPHFCIIAVVLVCFMVSCSRSRHRYIEAPQEEIAENTITIIGTPDAVSSPNDSIKTDLDGLLIPKFKRTVANQFLQRIAYVTSYNRETRNPNWVAWKLTREHTLGGYSRKGVPYYAEDGTVYGIGEICPESVKGCYFLDMESEEPRQLLTDWSTDYNMSHGHMCPAGDNKWDKAAINQSFLLTNMCPQDQKLNSGGWNKLEEKCRTWANQYGEIYIVAGPIFYNTKQRTLGDILIPDAFFKVVLCIIGNPKAIGFIYDNNSTKQSMKDKVCPVDKVESIVGIDFFSSLDDNIENEIESKSQFNAWR